MKSTYELVGACWDGLPAALSLPRTIPFNPLIQVAGSMDNLFDCLGKWRRVNLTELWSLGPEVGLVALGDCKGIAICIDFMPSYKGAVQQKYYHLRLRQAIAAVANAAPEAEIVLMESSLRGAAA